MATKKSKIVNFSPNEALAYGDLNDIQKAITQRAWEFPEFSNVASSQRLIDGTPSYGSVFTNTTGQDSLVFTKGAGLFLLDSGFVVTVYPGFVGIFSGTTGVAEFGMSSPAPSMRWAMVDASEAMAAVSNPGGALEQYSLIQARITESTSDVASRHFRDAATGALSSASTAKRRQLSVVFSIKNGTPAAIGTAVVPSLDAGESLVGYTRQIAAGIQAVYDCTVPFGPMKERVFFPNDGYNDLSTISNFGRTLAFSAINGVALYNVSQDPRERILGIGITHAFVSGTVINIALTEKGSLSPTNILSFTGGTHFTADGAQRELMINTAGKPIGNGGDVITHPIWGGGRTFKHDGGFFGYQSEGLVVQIISGGACSMYGVRVYSALA